MMNSRKKKLRRSASTERHWRRGMNVFEGNLKTQDRPRRLAFIYAGSSLYTWRAGTHTIFK